MRIAFYAPLKSPNHPVPSGDRLMARLLIRALQMGGHTVEIASEFRSFASTPEAAVGLEGEMACELQRLRAKWSSAGKADLWFCYHPYYKSVDPFGPALSAEFGFPLVTAEASYSPKRDQTDWAPHQARIGAMVRDAAINIAFTRRDRLGLEQAIPEARIAALAPFIDTTAFEELQPVPEPTRLITVAMMRAGDKMQSYTMLAEALAAIRHKQWTLAVVGDGPMRGEVERLFSAFEPGRIDWLGERGADGIAQELGKAGVYVWPGCGEAYGLAYLEAQAAGLPVVAQNTAGVPEVVQAGLTGLLTAEGDVAAYASAIDALLDDPSRRTAMARAARRFVLSERSLDIAAKVLDDILCRYTGKQR
ncbi:glycosyltransferase family 4 protein [Rhizobium metallidurans]|uniref:Glycosyltransferase involved in cell wall biosynthesis n=1 Tax=Rhizobium metallidurans TaxID=1265931 RepID=A0A7W6G964_9HYPH|nr:glycosyltransferase family 4 protein [Rhizobium metallidurans]MBB3962545.1 glycosyltransferase involved in cell wall biosynthesis [Rhizobium metallidurans]